METIQEDVKYDYTIEEHGGKKWAVVRGIVNLATMNHELDITEWVKSNVKTGGLFVDVGANVGCFTIRLSNHFERVISIEPQQTNLFMLRKNVEINDIKNVTVIDKAAWSENGSIFLHELSTSDFSGNVRTSDVPNSACPRNVEVEAITIDSLNISPSFVKIDIEGVEMRCLTGMTETMKRCKPVLLVEIHRCYGVNYLDVVNFLKGFGYAEKLLAERSETLHYVFE